EALASFAEVTAPSAILPSVTDLSANLLVVTAPLASFLVVTFPPPFLPAKDVPASAMQIAITPSTSAAAPSGCRLIRFLTSPSFVARHRFPIAGLTPEPAGGFRCRSYSGHAGEGRQIT